MAISAPQRSGGLQPDTLALIMAINIPPESRALRGRFRRPWHFVYDCRTARMGGRLTRMSLACWFPGEFRMATRVLISCVLAGVLAGMGSARVPAAQASSSSPAKAEAKPEPKPEPKPEAKPEPKPEPKPAPPPPEIGPVFFTRDVMPRLSRWGCNAAQCHGAAAGKGGLKLSLFAAEPDADYEALVHASRGRRINKAEPSKSLFLLKATGTIPHEGGVRVAPNSPDYNLLVAWVARGAAWGDPSLPKLTALRALPEEKVYQKGESVQLQVTAVFSDGSQQDVTPLALYRSTDEKVASVDAGGKVTVQGFGQAAIIAIYLRQPALARVIVPQPLAGPFPKIEPNNRIDELVFARLQKLGIVPSEVCPDEVFLRRVYLDTIGMLPTPDEARAFLADKDPKKRSRLIDQLLERNEFIDYWTLRWGDLLRIKSEYPVRVWPRGVRTYYNWVRESIARNKPMDQFARELITANGSNFRVGPANFFRAMPTRDPQSFAETTAVLFMGARIGCARCHGHPTENWALDDVLGMAAFFSKVAIKTTLEWKEEVVFHNPWGQVYHPKTRAVVKPKFLGGDTLDLAPEEDPRGKFADWLTSPQNPWFARALANRVWFWLFGRGIVHEPDDLRSTNPPSHPELLDYLAQELVSHKYDLKHLFRLVLNSKTYQLSSKPNGSNRGDLVHFSHYLLRRLGAEQFLEAVCQVTGTTEEFASWIPVPPTILPRGTRATQIFDGDIKHPFLDLFGRPSRDTPYECQRNLESSVRQSLHLLNSDHFEGKIAGSQTIQRLLQANKPDAEIVDELYLSALARFPRADEKAKALEYLTKKKDARAQAVQDLCWALLNTKEFMFNH